MKLTFHMGNLHGFVEQISKEKKDAPTAQEKDVLPQYAKPNTA